MKRFALLILVLSGCTSQHSNPRGRLIDQIENAVTLPAGARPLQGYARYYASTDKSPVWAVYVIPGPAPSGHEVCKDMDVSIPPEKWRTVPCDKASPEESYLPAGQRRWVSDPSLIPTTLDSLGCEQITFTYDPQNNTFVTKPRCSNQYQVSVGPNASS